MTGALNAIDRWFVRANGGDASIHLELVVRGCLDEERLRDAVVRAVKEHPRSSARLVGDTWVAPGSPVEVTTRAEAELLTTRVEQVNAPFDLATGPGVRLVHVKGADGDRLLFFAHHGLVDAVGLFVLVASIAAAYSGVPGQRPARVVSPPSRPVAGHADSVGALRMIARTRPASIAAEPGLAGEATHGLLERRLPLGPGNEPVTEELVTGLILAMASWNSAHGWAEDRLGALVAVNLRPLAARIATFANLSFALPVWLDPEERTPIASAVAVVRRRLRQYCARNVSRAVYDDVSNRTMLPPWFAVLTAQPAVVSNLGRAPALAFGDIPVVDWWGTPSVSGPMALAIATVVTPSGLHIGLRNRRAVLSDEATARFADQWLHAMATINGTHVAPAS